MIQDHSTSQDALVGDTMGSEQEESRRRRQKLLLLLRGRYHWAASAAVVLGIVAAVAAYFSQPDRYSAYGRLELNPQLPKVGGGLERPPAMWDQYVNTKAALVKNSRVMSRALGSETWKSAAAAAGIGDISLDDFADCLTSYRLEKSNLIDITFTHEIPSVALAGLDATVDAYKEIYQQIDEDQSAQLLDVYLTQQSSLEFELKRLMDQRRALSGGDYGSEVWQPQYQSTLEEQMRIQAELASVARQLDSIEAGDSMAQRSVAEIMSLDGVLAALDIEREAVQGEINHHRSLGRGEGHYQVRDLKARLERLDARFNERVAAIRNGRILPSGGTDQSGDIEQLRLRREQLEQARIDAETRVASLAHKLRMIQGVEEEVERVEGSLAKVKAGIQQIDLEKLISSRLEVLGTGTLPTEPSNRATRFKLAGAGLVGGGILGVGAVMLIGLMDPRLRHIGDTEVDLPDARLLGTLPTLPADLHDAEQAVLVAHSVHHIRTLLQIGHDPSGAVYSITSPASGSGKTSLTMALGLSFAASGSKTLLIDADIVGGGLTRRMGFVVHPRIGQILHRQGLVTEPQINDALRVAQTTGAKLGEALVNLGYVTEADVEEAIEAQEDQSVGLLEACGGQRFEECIAPTGIEQLYMLPIGMALPQQAGALSPSAMRRIIAQARTQFDTVLIDTGPLMGSLEASMAAAEADGTVLIVSRGDQKPLITRCVQHLQEIRGRLTGVVFNHALVQDITRSTYGSVTMSQSRHPNNRAMVDAIDADTSARFGPLATAVASYAASGASGASNGRGRSPGDGAAANGNGHANGKHAHAHANGSGNGVAH